MSQDFDLTTKEKCWDCGNDFMSNPIDCQLCRDSLSMLKMPTHSQTDSAGGGNACEAPADVIRYLKPYKTV